ncbi:MAG: hypothetical protein AB7O67_03255 [Vicinamibacterales bacterium]
MARVARRLGVSRATLWTIRVELEGAWVRARSTVWPPARLALAALRRRRDLLVNVASGPFVLPGFVNLELRGYDPAIVRWDCRRSLPLAPGSCAGIRLEQWVEHLDPRDELPDLLASCLRALGPGGVIRIIVPDTRRYLAAYLAGGREGFDALAVPDPLPADLPAPLDVVNHVFHQWGEHRWAYDLETLAWRLREAGFTDVRQARYRESRLPALAADREQHAPYSLYVEAVRPPEHAS